MFSSNSYKTVAFLKFLKSESAVTVNCTHHLLSHLPTQVPTRSEARRPCSCGTALHAKKAVHRSNRCLDMGHRLVTRSLTVKLRGRPKAPDLSRGCTLSLRTRGDTTDSHGPLQRLLDGAAFTALSTASIQQ